MRVERDGRPVKAGTCGGPVDGTEFKFSRSFDGSETAPSCLFCFDDSFESGVEEEGSASVESGALSETDVLVGGRPSLGRSAGEAKDLG